MAHDTETFDVAVVGGGPAGATAATMLARSGRRVLLIDKAGRIKPCGGAVPPRLLADFEIPASLVKARAKAARIVAPSGRFVDMPVCDSYVGMVDRDEFDEFLRRRAAEAGAVRLDRALVGLGRDGDGTPLLDAGDAASHRYRARIVVGADGANSLVARSTFGPRARPPFVFAYHEIVEAPGGRFDGARCDIHYEASVSPDFYAWIFPHGDTLSIGTGSARKGFALRQAVAALRARTGLDACPTLRREGAPIPLKPLRRWDNGRDIIVAGDAAGVVAPASGEGIFYAMVSGNLVAEAVDTALRTADGRALAAARRRFMAAHGRVFMVLRMMQWFWYRNDWLRERFVSLCDDPDVQRLTWEAYLQKGLGPPDHAAHLRIFMKDMSHLLGLATPWRRQA